MAKKEKNEWVKAEALRVGDVIDVLAGTDKGEDGRREVIEIESVRRDGNDIVINGEHVFFVGGNVLRIVEAP